MNTSANWQPVKILKCLCNMRILSDVQSESHCCILNTLQFDNLWLRSCLHWKRGTPDRWGKIRRGTPPRLYGQAGYTTKGGYLTYLGSFTSMYSLSQLKRSGLGTCELVQFFCTCIRLITEYACPVFHDGLPVYLSNELEGVQKRAMRIIFPLCSYNEALVESGLTKLSDRRQELVDKLFKNVLQNEQNKLHELLPARNTCTFNLRNMRKFKPAFKTNRFRSSFITFNALKAWTVLVDF